MNVSKFVKLLFVGAVLAMGAKGCKQNPTLNQLNWMKEEAIKHGDYLREQRIEVALSRWKNGHLDSDPYLLAAEMGKAIGSGNIHLVFFTYDEDKDIDGIGIIEEYIDPNGLNTTLTEEYETTGNRQYPEHEEVQLFGLMPKIRDAGQRKDEQLWFEYLQGKSGKVDVGQGLAPTEETMPAVWISIPEPNHVDLKMYVYDQQGHKSEAIRVISSIPRERRGNEIGDIDVGERIESPLRSELDK